MNVIYKISNKINGKIYIGSTVNFKSRKYHLLYALKNGKHHSLYFQKSFNKYGAENFIFEILEEVNDVNELLAREQFYLDTLTPYNKDIGYNILKIAGSTYGFTHSAESKKKISKPGDKHPMFGKKHSIDSRNKISTSQIGNKWKKETFDINSTKVLQFSKTNLFIKEWPSIREAMRTLKISNISRCCKMERKTSGGFIWKYKDF